MRSKILIGLPQFGYFGDFQINFRPKIRNFQNCLAGSPLGLVLLDIFENFDFLAENHSENLQNDQIIPEPDQHF